MNGAEGSTLEGMRGTLGFSGLTEEEINESYQDLIELLRGLDPNVSFGIGNSLWYREGFQIETPFIDTLREYFDARVQALDFSDPAAASTINAWVHESTDGMIDGIVDPPIDPLTMAFLINAIYFDGDWTFSFDPTRSVPGFFTHADGTTEPITLMDQTAHFQYTETDAFQAVDLPYGGQAFSMTILLPRDPQGLGALVEDLDAATWEQTLLNFQEKEVHLKLPRFELEYDATLNDVLKLMGMGDAFDPVRADFTRMHRDALDLQLHISKVKHKTFVEVDEVGTRAAGVTSVEVTVTAVPDQVSFVVDRPFLFAIRERFSGTILFIGAVGSFQ
jgi:serpin B